MQHVPLNELRGKVAFVTGGSSGIGLGIARACYAAGMRVAITYKTPQHLAEARTFFRDPPEDFLALPVDVADRAQMAQAADLVEDRYGSVNLLCNNAGVGITTSIINATYEDWDYALAVNVGGVVNGVQTFVPRMIRSRAPAHIVSTASMTGLFHGGSAGLYTTTKFAVVGLMEALRAELLEHRIGASVFCPGLVQSNIFLSRRNRPQAKARNEADDALELRMKRVVAAGMDALECGEKVLRGVRRNALYILTHPEFREGLEERGEVLRASFEDASDVPAERLRAEARVLKHPVYSLEKARLFST